MWEKIIPAAVNLISGSMGASASRSAGSDQASATDRATEEQRRQFDKQVELQAPFRDAGVSAVNRLAHLLGIGRDPSASSAGMTYEQLLQMADVDHRKKYGIGIDEIDPSVAQAWKDQMRAQAASGAGEAPGTDGFGSLMRDFSMSDFEADPGYAFRQSEGLKGIQSGAAARGGLLSGAALKAIQKYGQDLASQEYGNAYGRFTANQTNKYNKLAGLVNTGQGSANQLTNAAGSLGQATANNIMSGAAANAAGTVGAANAWTNAMGQGLGAWQQNQLMDLIRKPRTSAVGSGWGTGTGYGNQDYGSYF